MKVKTPLFDYRATLDYADENGRIKNLDIFRANLETGNIKEYFHLAAINSGIMHPSILKIERSKPGKGKWEVIYDFWKKIDKTEV